MLSAGWLSSKCWCWIGQHDRVAAVIGGAVYDVGCRMLTTTSEADESLILVRFALY